MPITTDPDESIFGTAYHNTPKHESIFNLKSADKYLNSSGRRTEKRGVKYDLSKYSKLNYDGASKYLKNKKLPPRVSSSFPS